MCCQKNIESIQIEGVESRQSVLYQLSYQDRHWGHGNEFYPIN